MTYGVILNPAAGGGRMGALWPSLGPALEQRLGPFALETTTGPGHAIELAEALARRGVPLIVAAGGDGTIGEVADGVLKAGGQTQLGVLSAGAGSDFARSLGVGPGLGTMIDALGSGRVRRLDAGRLSYVADDGSAAVRHFVNIASLGLSGPVARAVNGAKQRGRGAGKHIFLYHTLAQLIRYRAEGVRVRLDGDETIETEVALVAVANGRYFGGGMMIAPDAELDDGLFEVVVIRAASKLEMIAVLGRLYTGAHRGHPLVTIRRARSILVEPLAGARTGPVLLDIDGESPGRIPASFEQLPGALTVRT